MYCNAHPLSGTGAPLLLALQPAVPKVELPQHREQRNRTGRERGSSSQPNLPVIKANHMRAGACPNGSEDMIGTQHGNFLVVERDMPVRVVTVEKHDVTRMCEFNPKCHRIGLIVRDPDVADTLCSAGLLPGMYRPRAMRGRR